MYGDLADKLIAETRRAENLPSLPLYSTDLVRTITRETRELWALQQRADGASPKTDMNRVAIQVYQLLIERNKRCLLAYHYHRVKRLEQWTWNEQEPVEAGNLSTTEQSYVRQFNELLSMYKNEWKDIDIEGSLEPPKDMYIEVRCLKDAGEIQTEYGLFDLTKNSQFYVRQSDVQRLIAQGLVELVKK